MLEEMIWLSLWSAIQPLLLVDSFKRELRQNVTQSRVHRLSLTKRRDLNKETVWLMVSFHEYIMSSSISKFAQIYFTWGGNQSNIGGQIGKTSEFLGKRLWKHRNHWYAWALNLWARPDGKKIRVPRETFVETQESLVWLEGKSMNEPPQVWPTGYLWK